MNPNELKQEIDELKDSTNRKLEELRLDILGIKNSNPTDNNSVNRLLDNSSRQVIQDAISDNVLDIVWNDYFYYQTYFESLDGWNLIDTSAGSSIVSRLGVHLATGASTNDISSIDKEPVYQNVLSFDEESRFASSIFVTGVTNIEAFVGIGFVNNGATGAHYGFFLSGSTLKGTCADGSTQSTVDLLTISSNHPTTIDPIYYVEARFYPGYKIEFFVSKDGGDLIQYGSLSSNIPSGNMYEWLSAEVKTKTTASIEMRFGNMEYIQRRPKR